ncbi:hypothetical protein GGX14DRAFT_694232 [Mycena pura]|uniref:F-box domain-containing protein n=1 Tax=Mycena pura TaxID=153505 RepID=A0AAD6YNP3_9AGAR|nr:hypothetical protein GGX14DRAFT_694232 [Mycena pura]
MSGIQNLAVEIIEEISFLISWNDKKHLRSACRATNLALEPLILSRLVLDPRTPVERLELLASPSYPGSSFVKSVKIKGFGLYGRRGEVDDEQWIHILSAIRTALGPALLQLTNLQSVKWQLDNRDPAGISMLILDALSTLSVANLEILLPESPPAVLHFNRLHGLRSVSISIGAYRRESWPQIFERAVQPLADAIAKSPALESLTVRTDFYEQPYYDGHSGEEGQSCLQSLLARVDPGQPLRLTKLALHNDLVQLDEWLSTHLRCLNSLTLEPPPPLRTYNEEGEPLSYTPNPAVAGMWHELAEKELFPHSLQIAAPVDDTDLHYIKAHPCLQQLMFSEIDQRFDPEKFDVYADSFYADVLPRHATTLTRLSIDPGREGRWGFDVQSARAILQCRALTHLAIPLNLPERGNDDVRVDDACLLLAVALDLPNLNTLTIINLPCYTSRPSRCGTRASTHSSNWYSFARAAIEDYRVECPPVAKQMAFRLELDGEFRWDLKKVSYRLIPGDAAWHFVSIEGSTVNRQYEVRAVPPGRRISIAELYSRIQSWVLVRVRSLIGRLEDQYR